MEEWRKCPPRIKTHIQMSFNFHTGQKNGNSVITFSLPVCIAVEPHQTAI